MKISEKAKAATKKWRENNREYIREYNRVHKRKYSSLTDEEKVSYCDSTMKWQQRNRDKFNRYKRKYMANYPRERLRAHAAVWRAVKKGTLIKSPCCQLCLASSTRIYGHHQDYSKPLDVVWLCSYCHRGVHGISLIRK